jgi:FAD/FMN-containing dehydrogenase
MGERNGLRWNIRIKRLIDPDGRLNSEKTCRFEVAYRCGR